MQIINIIITTNEQPGQPSTMIEKFSRRQLWGGCAISRKLISNFDLNVFSIVVWILSQLTAFVLKLQLKNIHGQKSTVWKTALIPQYLLTRMLSIISSIGFFSHFSTRLMVVSIEMGYQYVSSLTQWTILPNSKIDNCDCLFCFC